MTIQTAILCTNPLRDPDFAVTQAAEAVLADAGIRTVRCLPFDAPGIRSPEAREAALADEIGRADLLVALGGDGTILHLAPLAARHGIPVLGINTGTLGFMAELEPDELRMLARLAGDGYRVERRTMLKARVIRDGREAYSATGLNDAVVTKGGDAKIIRLNARADGKPLGLFAGDGVIVATATGSTGYSLSAGGPVLDPETRGLVLTPICSHSAFARPFVLPAGRSVALVPADRDDKQMFLSVDGNEAFRVLPGDTVEVAASKPALKLVRLTGRTVYEVIRAKMSVSVG